MKRTISIVIALLAIFFALTACGGSQGSNQSSDQTTSSSSSSQGQSTSLPDVNGTYSGSYQFGSDSGNMSLSIGGQNGAFFSGQVELDISPGSAICYSTAQNIIDTNVDQNGDIAFSAYCGPNSPELHFTGNAQNGGWQGNLQDDSGNKGNWNVTPSSS